MKISSKLWWWRAAELGGEVVHHSQSSKVMQGLPSASPSPLTSARLAPLPLQDIAAPATNLLLPTGPSSENILLLGGLSEAHIAGRVQSEECRQAVDATTTHRPTYVGLQPGFSRTSAYACHNDVHTSLSWLQAWPPCSSRPTPDGAPWLLRAQS